MKVGIIVDGQTEVYALPCLLEKLRLPERQFKVLKADIQPGASSVKVARAARPILTLLQQQGFCDEIIIAIDLEQSGQCPGVRAAEIKTAMQYAHGLRQVNVVVKVRSVENWLIADPASINQRLANSFAISQANTNRIVPNKADHIPDALEILKAAKRTPATYEKRQHGLQIAKVLDTAVMAQHSRSFRRFLRIVGYPAYAAQSKRPAPLP